MKQLLLNIEMIYPSCDKYDMKDIGEFIMENFQDWLNANVSDGDNRIICRNLDVIGEGSFLQFGNSEAIRLIKEKHLPKDVRKNAAETTGNTLTEAVERFLLDYDDLQIGKDGSVTGVRDGKRYKTRVEYQIFDEEI